MTTYPGYGFSGKPQRQSVPRSKMQTRPLSSGLSKSLIFGIYWCPGPESNQ